MKKRNVIPLPKRAPKTPPAESQYKFGLLSAPGAKDFPTHEQQHAALKALVDASMEAVAHSTHFQQGLRGGGKPFHVFDIIAQNVTGTIDLVGGLKTAMGLCQTGHSGLKQVQEQATIVHSALIVMAQTISNLFPPEVQPPPQETAPKEPSKPEEPAQPQEKTDAAAEPAPGGAAVQVEQDRGEEPPQGDGHQPDVR